MLVTKARITQQMQAVLDKFAELGPLPIEAQSPESARQLPTLAEAVRGVLGAQVAKRSITAYPEPVGKIGHHLIPGEKGDILARVYTPSGKGPFPVLLYFHGGGWVIAGLDAYDSSCRSLANMANCLVVSVAYRQAPEYKFPVAIEEGFAAYNWARRNVASLNGDPERIAVGGESAGGNIAAVVALLCRDRGIPAPAHQLLIYPVTDLTFSGPSYEEHAEAKPLNRAMMKWFAGHYLKSTAEAAGPYVSPLRAANLGDLPPATVITAEIDPLMSDGEAYARKLEDAGCMVRYRNFEGVTHEFFGMKAVLGEAKEANEFAAQELITTFGR